MPSLLNLLMLATIVHTVWEILFRPDAFAERMRDVGQRVFHAAFIWVLAVRFAGIADPYSILLELPGLIAMLWCILCSWSDVGASLRGLFPSRKA